MPQKYLHFKLISVSLFLIGYFIALGIISPDLYTKVIITACYTIFFISSYYFLNRANQLPYSQAFSLKVITYYLIFAYAFKLPYDLLFMDEIPVLRNLDINAIKASLSSIIPKTLLVVLAIQIAYHTTQKLNIKYSKKRAESKYEVTNLRFSTIISFAIFSLLTKAFVYHVLSWGIPGMTPINTIPVLTGVITLYIRMPIFAFLNVAMAFFIASNNKPASKILALCVAFNVILDITVGAKYSLVYEAFFIACLFFRLRKGKPIPLVKTLTYSIFLILLLSQYKNINYLRFGLLDGMSIQEAAVRSVALAEEKDASTISGIINRINGIEHVLFVGSDASYLPSPSWDALWTSSYTTAYTEAATGVSDIVNAVGSNQIALLTLLIDSPILLFPTALLYFTFCFLSFRFIFYLFEGSIAKQNEFLKFSTELIFSIFTIYFIFATGNYIFYLKEILILSTVFIIIRLSSKRIVSGKPTKQQYALVD